MIVWITNLRFFRASIILVLLVGIFLSVRPVGAEPRALVIGIDKYVTVGELDGAVNDAKGIVDALRTIGVNDITALFDTQVTRKTVQDGWDSLIKRSRPGDILFFTYAGHGGEEPEHVKGSEKSGKDQNILFPRFNPNTDDNAERLIDDEIALMLKRAADAKLSVMMVMDACHSGTMTRGIDTRVRKFKVRAAKYPTIENDHIGAIDPAGANLKLEDQNDLLYLGAVQDHELAPEVEIDGKPHGALSVSVARGLGGAADLNHNGIVTSDEIETYVRESVRILMEGQQNPSSTRGNNISLTLPSGSAPSKPIANPFPSEAPTIAVQIMNADPARPTADLLAKINGVVAAGDPGAAVLTWDIRRGHLLNKLGDLVAYANERAVAVPPPTTTRGFGRSVPVAGASTATPAPSTTCEDIETRGFGRRSLTPPTVSVCDGLSDLGAVQKVVDKWRVVEMVRQRALQDAFTITLQPSDGIHYEKDNLKLIVSGQRYTYFTLFNIGSDGTVNFLYPLTSDKFRDPLEIPINRNYELDLTVQPPFGSDHFIAISSNQPLSDLHRDLAYRDGKQVAGELPAILARSMKDKVLQVGLHGVYTAPKL